VLPSKTNKYTTHTHSEHYNTIQKGQQGNSHQ
jgi:hypothetical protein